MRKMIVAMLFMSAAACGCAAHSQTQGRPGTATVTAASGADRQGQFARSAVEMSMCVVVGMHERHPEQSIDFNLDSPPTVSAKKYQSDEKAIWVAEFRDAGAKAADVTLRNVTANASDLDEVWRIVALCAEQGS